MRVAQSRTTAMSLTRFMYHFIFENGQKTWFLVSEWNQNSNRGWSRFTLCRLLFAEGEPGRTCRESCSSGCVGPCLMQLSLGAGTSVPGKWLAFDLDVTWPGNQLSPSETHAKGAILPTRR